MKLAMKRLSLAVLVVGVISVLPAHAEEWSKNYSLSGKPDLRIETSDANIRVTTWDQNAIEAKVITNRYKIGKGEFASKSTKPATPSKSRCAIPITTSTWDGVRIASTSSFRCRVRVT